MFVFAYDKGGNITSKSIYQYHPETLNGLISTENYSYDTTWKDKLTSWNGYNFEYDGMGNPTKYTWNDAYHWTRGRLLSGINSNIQYTYNSEGIRTTRQENDIITTYYLSGTTILGESRTDGKKFTYLYKANGIAGFIYNNEKYYFTKNIQGDILGVYNVSGVLQAKYIYDAWGNVTVFDSVGNINTDVNFIGNLNSFRYRSYYYDNSTKLYYLNTRYYNPLLGRFLNADKISPMLEQSSIINGLNLFAYCRNNPVMLYDIVGNIPICIAAHAERSSTLSNVFIKIFYIQLIAPQTIFNKSGIGSSIGIEAGFGEISTKTNFGTIDFAVVKASALASLDLNNFALEAEFNLTEASYKFDDIPVEVKAKIGVGAIFDLSNGIRLGFSLGLGFEISIKFKWWWQN